MSGTDYDDVISAITYSSGWTALKDTVVGPYKGTVHQTSVNGASATIKFTGTRIIVYQTVPKGDGTETANTDLDGAKGTISRHTHGDTAYYQDKWFDSGPLPNGPHTLIVSNGGDNGGTPLIIDKFNIEGSPIFPTTTSRSPATTAVNIVKSTTTEVSTAFVTNTLTTTALSTSTDANLSTSSAKPTTNSVLSSSETHSFNLTSTATVPTTTVLPDGKTVVSVQYITTAISSTITTPATALQSASSKGMSVGVIVGCTIGGLVVVALILLLCVCILRQHRRKAHIRLDDTEKHAQPTPRPTDITPFDLRSRSSREMEGSAASEYSLHSGLVRELSQGSGRHAGSVESVADQQRSLTDTSSPTRAPSPRSADPEKSDPSCAASPVAHQRPPEVDAGPFRSHYLSSDMIVFSPSSDIYTSAYFGRSEAGDVPPSYQSARGRDSTV